MPKRTTSGNDGAESVVLKFPGVEITTSQERELWAYIEPMIKPLVQVATHRPSAMAPLEQLIRQLAEAAKGAQ